MHTTHQVQREDNQLLIITHVLQLLTFITGFGGLIVPLIIWLTKKDEIIDMDEHGKSIVNFQLSLILYGIIAIPLLFILVGFVVYFAILVLALVFPIVNAVNASNNKPIYYPLTIPFIR
ncbi:DUF4870 domain-containing protein [Psychroflexus planctonicus]|uniref:DUF4870 domain-containing protein n=1 Tax=Psychroflexus planctonicus TaxID=1526575 RepID=A0ABQ1SGT2_9FLAO|nr:DUF4870 domain-containing protein [Psychroflexus planctonicus]GGE29324.1 hypothetical protein GCM10010832_07300 [Psychroflexus planctonicus]